ncbi:MAG TPA: hypothetical protein VL793_07915 [Patescibacteria group bacterium]|nr:hypothetical protein [Patescibacteria group bacterium]
MNGTKNLGFPIDLPLELNCAVDWFYEFGAARYFNGSWFLSAGYVFGSEPFLKTISLRPSQTQICMSVVWVSVAKGTIGGGRLLGRSLKVPRVQ